MSKETRQFRNKHIPTTTPRDTLRSERGLFAVRCRHIISLVSLPTRRPESLDMFGISTEHAVLSVEDHSSRASLIFIFILRRRLHSISLILFLTVENCVRCVRVCVR